MGPMTQRRSRYPGKNNKAMHGNSESYMNNNPLRKTRLAMAVAGAAALTSLSIPASAVQLQFDNPDWSGRLDTALSVGALFRTEGQDRMLAATGEVVDMTLNGYGSQIPSL